MMEEPAEEVKTFLPKASDENLSGSASKKEDTSNKLKRELGLLDAVSIIVGIIVIISLFAVIVLIILRRHIHLEGAGHEYSIHHGPYMGKNCMDEFLFADFTLTYNLLMKTSY